MGMRETYRYLSDRNLKELKSYSGSKWEYTDYDLLK